MKRNELIRGIEAISEGLEIIKNALLNEDAPAVERIVDEPKTEPKTEAVSESKYSREELTSMKYNELKKLANSTGVSATGTRAEIIERLLNAPAEAEESEGIEGKINPPVEPKEKVVPITKGKKKLAKKSKEVEETIDKKYLDMANSALEDMTEDEMKEMLEESEVEIEDGETVVHAFARALSEGKIEPADDEEEEEENEEVESEEEEDDSEVSDDDEEEDGDEVTGEDYFSDYDEDGVNDYSGDYMTKKRKKAMIAWQTKFLEDYDKDKITLDEVTEAVQTLCTQDELDNIDADKEEDIVCTYMEVMKRCIDSDGELHEGGDAYEINDEYFCCGHKLKEVDGKFVCEVCGAEYEQ